ncbi:MAG: hypothetical protein AB7F43_01010 [Bacteriovoracia bacterium]
MKKLSLVLCLLVFIGCSHSKRQTDLVTESSLEKDLLPGVQIVYSANMRGDIESCNCKKDPAGGVQRRWNLLHSRLSKSRLSLDSGDLFFYTTPIPPFLERLHMTQALAIVDAYNELKVDVFSPGELDFGAGLENFELLRSRAKFEFVSANILKKNTLQRLLKPFVILTRNGKKIAIFGLFDESLELPEELVATNHIDSAKEIVSELAGKVDITIALTHLGYEKDLELARNVPEINAIFGAHSMSYLDPPVLVDNGDQKTLIFQTSLRGQHLGLSEGLELSTNGHHEQVLLNELLDSPSGKPNPMDLLLAKTRNQLRKIQQESDKELLQE